MHFSYTGVTVTQYPHARRHVQYYLFDLNVACTMNMREFAGVNVNSNLIVFYNNCAVRALFLNTSYGQKWLLSAIYGLTN